MDTLNDIFTYFDRLCLIHGVEKIKTIAEAPAGRPALPSHPITFGPE